MGLNGSAPGPARLHVVDGVPLLRPAEQVFDAMLDGWRNQQLARNLALGIPATAGRAAAIRQHVLDMPAPVVATAFGYHHVTTTRLAREAGTTLGQLRPRRARIMSRARSHPSAIMAG